MLVVCLGFAGAFALLYLLAHLGPSSIDGKQSWIDQIIDSRLIIALLRVVVIGGVVFIVASILKAAAEDRALVSFFAGARVEEVEEAKDKGFDALAIADVIKERDRMRAAEVSRLEHELGQAHDSLFKLHEATEALLERATEEHELLVRLQRERGVWQRLKGRAGSRGGHGHGRRSP